MLQVTAGALGWAAAGAPQALAAPRDSDVLDEALRRLHRREPASINGLSTHAPMAVEALCALGQADRALGWLDRYRGPTVQLPPARARIAATSWRAALGPDAAQASWEQANPRWRDWIALFSDELAGAPWRSVVDTWVGRLAPGMAGAATHGVIRTSHAVRAMLRRDTPERRAELARGLAYWASSYEEVKGRGPAVELDRLALYHDVTGHPAAGRNIVEQLRHIAELPGFPAAPAPLADGADPAASLSQLTRQFARAYLRHGTRHHTIAFLHAVTGPCALRRMAPCLSPATLRAALPHAWQTAMAIYAIYARRDDPPVDPAPRLSPVELVGRALDSGDEHAIKFTEALLAEHALAPDPAYLAAAEHAVAHLR